MQLIKDNLDKKGDPMGYLMVTDSSDCAVAEHQNFIKCKPSAFVQLNVICWLLRHSVQEPTASCRIYLLGF